MNENGDIKTEKPISHGHLEASDPGKILSLCSQLTDRNSVDLQKKINKYLEDQTEASSVFLVPFLDTSEEAIVQVVGQNSFEKPLRLSKSDSIINAVLKKEKPHLIKLTDLDKKIQDSICSTLSVGSRTVMVPVWDVTGNITLLAGLTFSHRAIVKEHQAIKITKELFRFCLTLLLNTVHAEEQFRLKTQCQRLLQVARRLFAHLGNLDVLLRGIMAEARTLTSAERCSLFLMDADQGDLVAKVFDGGDDDQGSTGGETPNEVRIKLGQGIAGHVAVSGRLLNIIDAYENPLFYKGLDEKTGFVTRNILCFPIRDEDGIVGVAQLCNKVGGMHFDACDEEVAGAFSIYCGISIMHCIMYKKILDAQARTNISNEMLMYHLKVNHRDVTNLVKCRHQHRHPQLTQMHFNSRLLNTRETPCYILLMFEQLNLCKRFNIHRDTLARFTLYVQKGYRDMPYHNWMHAFSVTHFGFASICSLKLLEEGYLTDLECLAYLVSCLCHDLDHRGTSNSFEVGGGSVLAALYSSEGSVMERHHLSQALCILNSEGCNILQSLPASQYDLCLQLIRDCILATDLSNHFKHMKSYHEMVANGFEKENSQHHRNLLSMLMTCADLADQIKDWLCIKKVAASIYTEFFHQGDEEKQRGLSPQEMMDREKAFIPDLQIQFLENITIPVFKLLSSLFPEAHSCVSVMQDHMRRWSAARGVFDRAGMHGGYELLRSSDLDSAIDKQLLEDDIDEK